MFNKNVYQFIRSCTHFQLVDPFYYDAQKLIRIIESDTPFGVILIDFWGPVDIPYQYGYFIIMTYLDDMTVFGLLSASVLKKITPE